MVDGSHSVALILSAFGNVTPSLEPALTGFREQFPASSVTLYTEGDAAAIDADVRRVTPPFDCSDPADADRARGYFQVRGLLDSTADVAIAMTADLRIVSDEFRTFVPITARFGLAVAASPRLLTAIDRDLDPARGGAADRDPTGGAGVAIGASPWAFRTARDDARATLEAYLRILETRSAHGPAVLSEAAWETGFHPYVLPFNWCMEPSREIRVDHLDGHEIVLHAGVPGVEREWRTRRAVRALRDAGRAIVGKRRRP